METADTIWDSRQLYETCSALLGQRVNVVNGELVASPDGQFPVQDVLGSECFYLSQNPKAAVPRTASMIGRPYERQTSDCVALTAQWQDRLHGTKLYEKYQGIRIREYLQALDGGVVSYILSSGFIEIDPMQARENDICLYNLTEENAPQSHVGTFIGADKILHQAPFKLSSLDPLERERVQRVFRYGV